MKRGWSITSHGTGHHEQRYATKDGITVLIQPIPANSYWGRQKNARYRLTYNRDVPDADSLVPQAKFFSTYEGVFDWLENPPFEIKSFDAESYGAETLDGDYRAEGGCSCGANSSMGGKTFAACGCGSKKKAETFDVKCESCRAVIGTEEEVYDEESVEWYNIDGGVHCPACKDEIIPYEERFGAETFEATSYDEEDMEYIYDQQYEEMETKLRELIDKGQNPSDINLENVVFEITGDTAGRTNNFSSLMNEGREWLSNMNEEDFEAETFGAESRFDTLANKVAKDYESKGYSDKEAMEIGKKVAYSQGVKKYGKAGMTRLSKAGRKKAMKKSADSYSLNAELGQVNTMQATQSWQNSEPYATLEGYNPVDSVIASPPLGRGATQDFGAEYEGHQGYDDKMDESMGMRHGGKHSQSMKDRRDEASAMDKRHSKMGRKYDDVMTMDAEYDSPYGPRQSTNFGMVGMGNDFAQNAAETFSAEGGSEFMTGARYGAGAVIGITGATLILGTVMNLFMRK